MDLSQRTTPEEQLIELGERLRAARIRLGLNQRALAVQADVSLTTLSHLETGRGTTLISFVKVLRTLGLQDGLKKLVPTDVLDPLAMTRNAAPRLRAAHTRRRKAHISEDPGDHS